MMFWMLLAFLSTQFCEDRRRRFRVRPRFAEPCSVCSFGSCQVARLPYSSKFPAMRLQAHTCLPQRYLRSSIVTDFSLLFELKESDSHTGHQFFAVGRSVTGLCPGPGSAFFLHPMASPSKRSKNHPKPEGRRRTRRSVAYPKLHWAPTRRDSLA